MSNHCWNNVIITGDPVTLAKLEVLFNTYEQYNYLAAWANSFFPEMTNKPSDEDYLFYGTRWWEFDINMMDDNILQISGDSSWTPPIDFIQIISEYYKVDCSISFSESGCDLAGDYEWESGVLITRVDSTYSQHTYNHQGLDGIIQEYLYDNECYDHYDNAKDFVEKLGLENFNSEDLETLNQYFTEEGKPLLNKDQALKDLQEIITHLGHLEMNSLCEKVKKIHFALSNEWAKYLNTEKNE